MNLERVIIGVDLDGVCSDFYGRMREIAAEWFERDVEELTPDVSYGLPEWGIKSKISMRAFTGLRSHSEDCSRLRT